MESTLSSRLQKIKDNIPKKFFYEKSFDTSFRNKILSDINLDYSKVDHGNILACSPLLNKDQEQHLFRKYNYLKYRLMKATVGFEKSTVKPYPKPSKPVNLYKLGNKSLCEIERLIDGISELRNLLLKSNLRLIIKHLSKYFPQDSYERDEFFSHGYCHVMKAVEHFDYRKGYKFSTYCVNVLKYNFYRDNSTKNRLSVFLGNELNEDELVDQREADYLEINQGYNRRFIEEMFVKMKTKIANPDVKIKVIKDYYGLGVTRKNLNEIAAELCLSKERIRQIKLSALNCLSNQVGKEMIWDPLV